MDIHHQPSAKPLAVGILAVVRAGLREQHPILTELKKHMLAQSEMARDCLFLRTKMIKMPIHE
jgi:hypothetical protein